MKRIYIKPKGNFINSRLLRQNIIYPKFQMYLKGNTKTLGLLLLLCIAIHSQKMEDFTYAQYTVQTRNSRDSKIYIYPDQIFLDHYEFPKACDITQFQNININKESLSPKISNIDGQIDFLKTKVSQFLKLSDKAQLLTKNLKELPSMKNELNNYVREEQLAVLEQHQKKLSSINNQINNQGVQLQKIVNQMMRQQQNPLFKQSYLNFEKKALEQKVILFKNLLQQAYEKKDKVDKKRYDERLTAYFGELQDIFDNETDLVDEIDTLLRNHNDLAVIKANVTSLSSQVRAHDLTIAEKQECQDEFVKIKQKQKHDKQVIKLIESLKNKKMEFNEVNKYCEGVVTKLTERVHNLLAGYDYVYNCAKGLDQVKRNRNILQRQLDEAQAKLDQLKMSKAVDQFRKQFESRRAIVQAKVDQLKGLQISQFYRNPISIENLISSSLERIAQIERELQNLPTKVNPQMSTRSNEIQRKVKDIKELKAQYCRQNQIYQYNSDIVEDKLRKLEQQEEYNSWVSTLERSKLRQLQAVKLAMGSLQQQIQNYMREQ